MSTRRRRLARAARSLLRAALALTLLLALALGGLALAWRGDPTARIVERAGELASVELLGREESDGHVVVEELLTSTSGLQVRVRTRWPVGAPDAPRRALLLAGGYRTGRRAADLVADTRGSLVAAIDYPYDGDLSSVRGPEILRNLGPLRAALLDTPAALMLVRRHLAARPDVDGERIELVGASLGAMVVCYAGGIDEGFARVWCLHGGGDVDRLVDAGLRRKIGLAPVRALVRWIPRYAMGGRGPEAFVARIAPRPFVMINAAEDERFPRECVDALFGAAREPRELIWVDGRHVGRDRPETIEALTDAMFARMER